MNSANPNPLESIYYIQFPENFSLSRTAMKIDPKIPLPVQKKDKAEDDTPNIKDLSQEQILAGILTVLAYDRHNEHLDYYRNVLRNARPGIKKELSEAAILKAKNEDYDIAEEMFAALRGFDPDDMLIVLNTALFFDERASSYRRSGLHEDADAYDNDAQNYYRQAMDAEPAIPEAFFNAGFFYLKQYNYKQAKDCFETYIALIIDTPDEELGENGVYKRERAQEIINNVTNQNIDDSHFKATYDLISSGQEEKALDEIYAFIKTNQKVWNAWFMLGWALRRLQRFSDAKQAFLESVRCPAGDSQADTYNELAICCMEQGDLQEAKHFLKTALNLDRNSTKIMSNLGFVALKEGKTEEAKKYFSAVLAYDPNDKIALAEIARLENC
ncbi:MAG: tetratricopeptide repeat protein [Treponema sp.]|nr:tetratricopeptide repeat protein [Treponema sp.]